MQRGLWPELRERALEEARWGLAWLRQSRFAPGWRITQASFNMYTDGVVGTNDDVVIPATNVPFENILAAMVSAYAARVLRDTDPVLSAALLTRRRKTSSPPAKRVPSHRPGGTTHGPE